MKVRKVKITPEKLNWLALAKILPKGEGGEGVKFLEPYMKYPKCKKCRYVIQTHVRRKSIHYDWRMEVNEHLIGWTVLGQPDVKEPLLSMNDLKKILPDLIQKWKFGSKWKNVGFRAETKCPGICDEWMYNIESIEGEIIHTSPRKEELSKSLEELAAQPKVWLKVRGFIPKGGIGATKNYPALFEIVDEGYVYFGTLKPYFKEYFLKSTKKNGLFDTKDWTRVIVRAVKVPIIDPETKKPKKGFELMWRVLVPGDQTPYCLKRGMKKGWVPPKDYIPVPPEWRKGDEYEKWYEWVKEQWGKKKEKKSEELSEGEFVVHFLSWMGQVVVRGIPNMRWLLRLKEGNKVRSWIAERDFLRYSPVPLVYEGVVDKKWFDFEGEIKPGEHPTYNPTKKLTAKMTIVDRGKVEIDREVIEGAEILTLHLKGKKFKGIIVLSQEEEKSPFYVVEQLSERKQEDLKESTFELQLHEIETRDRLKKHWDIRIAEGFEFNLAKNPLESDNIPAILKECGEDIKDWMGITERTKKKVGSLTTWVTPIDKGKVTIISYQPPNFVHLKFEGKKLKGFYVYKLVPKVGGIFRISKFPETLMNSGNPETGEYYNPFRIEKKKNWDYYWVYIYDKRVFTRCVENPEEYIPELKNKPEEILEVLVCLYRRPGTIHGARVSAIKVSDKMSPSKAFSWIKKNKLHTWQGEMIRKKSEKNLNN